jgi:arylsulfatase A-like enzyme
MELSVDETPTNVYIFVADALRFDSLPSTLVKQGSLVKTVSSSPLSCTAFSTMFTGLYPPQHGVWQFSDTIPESVPTLFDLVPTTSPTYMLNTITDGIDGVQQYTELSAFTDAVDTATEPFVIVDRELCTHAPYGYDMAPPEIPEKKKEFTSLNEYWTRRASDPDKITRDYERSAKQAYERFTERIQRLENRGVLDDTLVIFTADHGEVIGEYRMYGHAPVLTAESVYVPTLFYDGGFSVDVEGEFMAHIDLLPTLYSLFNEPIPDDLPGYNLVDGTPKSRLVFNAKRQRYTSWGAFDESGGYTFSDHGVVGGLLSGLNRLINTNDASLNRRHPLQVLSSCLQRERTFGEPTHSEQTAQKFCQRVFDDEIESVSQEIDASAKQRLQALGYTENEIE